MAAEMYETSGSSVSRRWEKISLWLRRFRSSPNFVLVTVCWAIFNDVFLFGTIIPVLPFALPNRVDINVDDVQIWIVVLLATYGGALIIGSLIFGWAGDRMPRRHPIFLFGLACLLGATILISFGRHVALLIIARFLQGLAAAITWTSGLALLMDIFGKERYGEAMGYGQTSVSIGTISAPLLGGTVYAKGGFSAVSAMSIGVVALAFTLGCIMIEPKAADGVPEITVNGNSEHSNDSIHRTMSREVQSIESRSISNGSAVGEQPQPDEETALLGVNLNKNRPSKPAYHILLGNGRILAAMCGIFTYAFVIISFEGLIPLFVKETFNWDSTHTALIFLSWIIPGLLAPIAGMASDRLGSRWVASGGFLFAVAPLILMRLVTHNSTGQKALLSSLLTLVGLGLAWVMPSCTSDLTSAAAALKAQHPSSFGDSGSASTQAFGLFVFAYSCGTCVGPTVAGIIKAELSWGAATGILAVACAGATVPIILKTPTGSRKSRGVAF